MTFKLICNMYRCSEKSNDKLVKSFCIPENYFENLDTTVPLIITKTTFIVHRLNIPYSTTYFIDIENVKMDHR